MNSNDHTSRQPDRDQALALYAGLKHQVNPHFFFNNLSILSALVRLDPGLSEQFIHHLSQTFRYMLDLRPEPLVSLREELEFAASYGFLLQQRFQEKFDLRLNLPAGLANQLRIVPLTLQVLLENAIHYNQMSTAHPLRIEVLHEDGCLMVRNTRRSRPSWGSLPGCTLAHLQERYADATGLHITAAASDDWFSVSIPLIGPLPDMAP